jgi:acetyltransferase
MFSVGNSAQIGVEDIVEYWDENFDENSSKNKLLYLEKIDNPQKLLKNVSSLIKKGCRVAAIKAGASEAGSRAASSHTGALSSNDTAVDALFKKAGIVRCYSREELVYAGAIFQYQELLGDKLAIITHAGGPGVMLADALSKNGLKVPTITDEEGNKLLKKLYDGSSISNPIDFLATGTAEQLSEIIDFVNNDLEKIDAMVVIFGSPGLFDVSDVYDVLLQKIKNSKKPIYPVLPSIVTAKSEVDYFISKGGVNLPDEVFFANILGRIYNTPKPQSINEDKEISIFSDELAKGYLSPENSIKLLDFVRIERVQEYIVTTKEELIELKKELTYPIVMKVVGPLHKTDVGGVRLNIQEENMETVFDEIINIKDAKSVLIQPMISGLELFIGVKKEGDFGHVIFAGLGGIFIEVLKDVSKRLAPISRDDAYSMLRELKGYKLLEGVRGQNGININKFAETIIKVSNLVSSIPEIEEMDINPLIAQENNLMAVDVRIKIG